MSQTLWNSMDGDGLSVPKIMESVYPQNRVPDLLGLPVEMDDQAVTDKHPHVTEEQPEEAAQWSLQNGPEHQGHTGLLPANICLDRTVRDPARFPRKVSWSFTAYTLPFYPRRSALVKEQQLFLVEQHPKMLPGKTRRAS
jgi:hypothetical protein